MFFTSTFQIQQSIFPNTIHSSFSRKFSNLRNIQSLSSSKQCPPHSQSLPPHSKPRTAIKNPTETLFSNHNSSWLKSWGQKSIFCVLPNRPRAALDYRNNLSSDDEEFGTSASTGSSTMSKIVERLKRFGYIDDSREIKEQPLPEKGSVEDIFYAEDGILPNSRGGLSLDLSEEVKFPWEKTNGEDSMEKKKRKSKSILAELTLPQGELRRLRHLAIRAKSKTKIGGAGVTHEIVDVIREKWETVEVVRLKCEGAPALNMKRMHEILEV